MKSLVTFSSLSFNGLVWFLSVYLFFSFCKYFVIISCLPAFCYFFSCLDFNIYSFFFQLSPTLYFLIYFWNSCCQNVYIPLFLLSNQLLLLLLNNLKRLQFLQRVFSVKLTLLNISSTFLMCLCLQMGPSASAQMPTTTPTGACVQSTRPMICCTASLSLHSSVITTSKLIHFR